MPAYAMAICAALVLALAALLYGFDRWDWLGRLLGMDEDPGRAHMEEVRAQLAFDAERAARLREGIPGPWVPLTPDEEATQAALDAALARIGIAP